MKPSDKPGRDPDEELLFKKRFRIYMGFNQFDLEKTDNTLLVYSRGRLMKKMNAFNRFLGLSGSSSLWQLGLTVIVDDFNSQLTLTPTKEDFKVSQNSQSPFSLY